MADKQITFPRLGKFLPAKQFLAWFLETVESGGVTLAQALRRLDEDEHFEKWVFSKAGRTAEDLALHEAHLRPIREARDKTLAEASAVVVHALQYKIIVGIGHTERAVPLALPARIWHALRLDFETNIASNGEIRFHNVLLCPWRDLDEEGKAKFEKLANRTQQWLLAEEWAARKPTEPPPGTAPDRPLNVAVVNNPGFIDSIRRGEAVMAGARKGGQRSTGNHRKVSDAEKEKWRGMARELWERHDDWFQTDVAKEIQKQFPDRSPHTIKKIIAPLDPRDKRPRGQRRH